MVKDDLAAFQEVCGIYNKSSRCKAIKHFFARLSRPDFYLFIIICVTVVTFASVVSALAMLIEPKGRDTLVMTMGLISGVGVAYFYLLKKYSLNVESAKRYKDLLTDKFYQYDRYVMFKAELDQKKDFSLAPVMVLIESKLQVVQGWGAFPAALLGIFVSLMITVIYSAAPSDPKENFRFIAWVTCLAILLLMVVFALYDPLLSKSNRYRELHLFLTVYKSDDGVDQRVEDAE